MDQLHHSASCYSLNELQEAGDVVVPGPSDGKTLKCNRIS